MGVVEVFSIVVMEFMFLFLLFWRLFGIERKRRFRFGLDEIVDLDWI